MNTMHISSKVADQHELTDEQLDVVCGGTPSNHGRGDGLGQMRDALGGGLLGEIATVIVQGVRSIRGALGI